MPTQPGRFGYLGPSPFGPFDLGPGGTTRQRIGTPTTPSPSVAVQRLRDKDKPYGPPPPLGREGVPIPNVRAGRNRRHFTHAEIDNINDFAFGGAYHPRQIIPSMDIEAEGRRLGLGALTTPSDRQMANQAARTMQQQLDFPDPLNRAPIATPLPTGSQVSKPQYSPYRWPNMPPMMPIDDLRRWSQGTEDEQAALRKQYEDKPWSPYQVDTRQPDYITSPTRPSEVLPTGSQVSTEVPLMRGSSQVSTPQLEDRTYVAGWGYMTRDDMMRFNHGTPEEKARIRAKYQR